MLEIKSGTNGTTYCTPMDQPRCKSHFAAEAQRLNERRELDRRNEELERRDRQRQREYEWSATLSTGRLGQQMSQGVRSGFQQIDVCGWNHVDGGFDE